MHIRNLIKTLEATPPHARDNTHLLIKTPDGKFYRYNGVTFETPFHNPRVIISAGEECDAAGAPIAALVAPVAEKVAPTPCASVDTVPAPDQPAALGGQGKPTPSGAEEIPSPVTTADTQAQPPEQAVTPGAEGLASSAEVPAGATVGEEVQPDTAAASVVAEGAPAADPAPESAAAEQKPDAAPSAS